MVWPELGDYNEWKQTSNPNDVTTFGGIVTGFECKFQRNLCALTNGQLLLVIIWKRTFTTFSGVLFDICLYY